MLIDDSGNARLSDFGLTSILGEEADSGLTTTTEHVGTLRYSAPEILATETDDAGYKPTLSSDIFSLGCVVYKVRHRARSN